MENDTAVANLNILREVQLGKMEPALAGRWEGGTGRGVEGLKCREACKAGGRAGTTAWRAAGQVLRGLRGVCGWECSQGDALQDESISLYILLTKRRGSV